MAAPRPPGQGLPGASQCPLPQLLQAALGWPLLSELQALKDVDMGFAGNLGLQGLGGYIYLHSETSNRVFAKQALLAPLFLSG